MERTHTEWRQLEAGEIIQEGDEVEGCRDSWRDPMAWEPAKCIGQPAPDPSKVAHRIYRRRV